MPQCDELDEVQQCSKCERLADVAVDGDPECPKHLSQRTDRTGSWDITARESRKRIRKKRPDMGAKSIHD